MGVDTIILGTVGSDNFGASITSRLGKAGVGTGLIRLHHDLPTGAAHVGYNADGSRNFVFHIAGTAADAVRAEETRPLIAGADILHLSGASFGAPTLRRAAVMALEFAQRAGVRISLDPNVRPELMSDPAAGAALRDAMAAATWLIPSEEDLAELMPEQDPIDAARSLAAEGKTVVLTRGIHGAVLIDGALEVDRPALKVDILDATGAGDSFAATFLASILQGDSAERSLELAIAAGAMAVTTLGPMEGNSSREDVERMAAEGERRT